MVVIMCIGVVMVVVAIEVVMIAVRMVVVAGQAVPPATLASHWRTEEEEREGT